jgi:hypothetical protein
MKVKNSTKILKGVIIIIIISLNFVLLNKVTKNSKSDRSIEKNIRLMN